MSNLTGIRIWRRPVPVLCIIGMLLLVLWVGGGTQPASSTDEGGSTPVTVVKNDSSHLTVRFNGGQGIGPVIELEVAITDSAGKNQVRSIGSRLSTTPLSPGTERIFTGSFSGASRVLVIGYFSDASVKVLLDTTV